jgi:hypothetical protein
MSAKHWLAGTAAAIVLGLASMTAEAAPSGSAAADLKAAAGQGSAAVLAHWYRRDRYYRPYYYSYRPYYFVPRHRHYRHWRHPRWHYGYFYRPWHGYRHHHRHRHWW